MTCTRHGGNDNGSIYCAQCDHEVVERERERENNLIRVVYTRLGDFVYGCMAHGERGFVCGACGRGTLGREPAVGAKCPKCDAHVSDVHRGPPPPHLNHNL